MSSSPRSPLARHSNRLSPRRRAAPPPPRPLHGRGAAELDHLDDARLVLLCRGGDEAAWRVLVLRYQSLVYSIPNRMGLQDDECDEIFLETFARLVQWVGRVQQPDRVRAWLVTTARRLGLDALSRQRRQSRAAGDELATNALEDEAILDRLARVSQRDLVHRALTRIGRHCRQLLALLYPRDDVPGLSYREISQRLELPVGSIGPTRARCLHKLLVEYRRLESPPRGTNSRRSDGCTRPPWS